MSKMGSHDPFEHLKHKLWPKESHGVKLVVWLQSTKSEKSTQFPCVQVVCNTPLKSFWQGLQFCFGLHLNRRFIHKVMGPQNRKSRPGTKCHLDVGLVERHIVYYKGEGGGFPKSRPWWILWIRGCLWVLTPKVLKLCTNQLVVRCVQIHVSD
jgi:hypothetical protein